MASSATSKTTALLGLAIEAHGGLKRWRKVSTFRARASITGSVWHLKGRPDVLADVAITADTKRERVVMDFPGQDKRTIFTPRRVIVENVDGDLVAQRDDPKRHLTEQATDEPWDDIDVAYFSGEAIWTYITTPFLLRSPGFATKEMVRWYEDGERWRGLKATFPAHVASHTRKQHFLFGPDGLLRRHDYTVDVLGGTTGASYALEPRTVDGIVIHTARRVYGFEGDHQVVPDPVLIAVDLTDPSFR